MFKAIGNFLMESAIGNTIYKGYAIIVVFTIAMFIWQYLDKNPKKSLDFITKAYDEGCMAVGALSCLTMHGKGRPEYYLAEYMYLVDGKRYFVTYKMNHTLCIDDRMEEMNADMLLFKIKPVLLFFYDKKKPSKVMSKLEVFTSEEGMNQAYTPKRNSWRNVHGEWTAPIDLVKY